MVFIGDDGSRSGRGPSGPRPRGDSGGAHSVAGVNATSAAAVAAAQPGQAADREHRRQDHSCDQDRRQQGQEDQPAEGS
jgi:hypothetical protein